MSAPARAWVSACSARISSVGIVRNLSAFNHSTMPVIRVFAQADVRNDNKLSFAFRIASIAFGTTPSAPSELDPRASFVLWQSKQNNSGDSQRFHFPALFHNLIRRLLINSRH